MAKKKISKKTARLREQRMTNKSPGKRRRPPGSGTSRPKRRRGMTSR